MNAAIHIQHSKIIMSIALKNVCNRNSSHDVQLIRNTNMLYLP